MNFLTQYGTEIGTLTVEHLWLTVAAMLFATAIAVPAGIGLTRAPRWAKPVIGVANVLQTIPSLAMFGFLLPLPWLGERFAKDAESYQYLAESIRMHPDQETLKTMMEQAGLDGVKYYNLSAGVVALHVGTKY